VSNWANFYPKYWTKSLYLSLILVESAAQTPKIKTWTFRVPRQMVNRMSALTDQSAPRSSRQNTLNSTLPASVWTHWPWSSTVFTAARCAIIRQWRTVACLIMLFHTHKKKRRSASTVIRCLPCRVIWIGTRSDVREISIQNKNEEIVIKNITPVKQI